MRWILQLLGLRREEKAEKPHISRELGYSGWPWGGQYSLKPYFYWRCKDSRGLGVSTKGPLDAYREYIADIGQRARRDRLEKLGRNRT